MRQSKLARLAALCLVLAVASIARSASRTDKSSRPLSPREKEAVRFKKVMRWAVQTNASQRDLVQRLYQPVIEGNKKDYARNVGLGEKFAKKADEASRKRDEDAMEKYQDVSMGFHALAKQNKAIVKAVGEGDGQALNEAFLMLKKIEKGIEKLTGKTLKRDWLMPEELSTRSADPELPSSVKQ